MRRMLSILVVALGAFTLGTEMAWASPFTPLEWQQMVRQHPNVNLIGQRKHTTWIRDLNRNFIDDELEARFSRGQLVNIIVDFNTCLTPAQIQELLLRFGRVIYIGKLITFVMVNEVPVDSLPTLAALPQVAMVEWQVPGQVMNDVSTRAVQARSSNTYPGQSAQEAGFAGTGVNIAILDTGVDDEHEAFSGRFVAGFNALKFEDSNANGIDDSCEPAPLGNGVCTDPDDEPGDGKTNPDDDNFHGTRVASIALGRRIGGATIGGGRVCRKPDDGSSTNCGGVASEAKLVDIKICDKDGRCTNADVAEGLDWVGQNVQKFNIRVANLSIGFCLDDDGTSAMPQQVNHVAALGVSAVVAHGNANQCFLSNGDVRTMAPGSASFAITFGGTDDKNTVTRTDDTIFGDSLRGPRKDFTSGAPNVLALKPDLVAPAKQNVTASFNTFGGYFNFGAGTSFASPHGAGAAAILIEAYPKIVPGSLKDLLKRSADVSKNTAAFSGVDPNWDTGFGFGMLNIWPAVDPMATKTDVRFPNCVGAPSSPGQPCALTPPLPSWNNSLDIDTDSAPQVGNPNMITAQVRNDAVTAVTVLVNFGVYVFAVGNNQFFHIGTRQVTISPTMTMAVKQPWTPSSASHQCIQVSIDFGPDSDYGNNVTQRNLQVLPSVYQVQIENPFMVPARLLVQAVSERAGWQCQVSEESFTLDPFQDCPRQVRVTFNPPPGTAPGERANCNVTVVGIPEGEEPRVIGGVTVQTFVPPGGPVSCATICFRLPQFFLTNPISLRPGESVIIGGVNFEAATRNLAAIKRALQGGTSPSDHLNQQFVAAQLSLIRARGHSSPPAFGARSSPLSCYGLISVNSIALDNGVTLSPASTLNDLFEQARLALRQHRIADMVALTGLFTLLNGPDSPSRCRR